ncbi:MAG: alpha/beta fold hydrolase [Woeseiaceae bacterium]
MTTDHKPVVVLIPGMGNNARIWTDQVHELSDDYEVIVADYSGAESIDEMADTVLAQVPAGSFSLVGFSLGGYIAMSIIDRVGERIERLALVSSSPYADTEQAVQQREFLISKAQQNYNAVLEDMGQFIVFADGPHAENAREVLTIMGQELGAEEFCRQQRATMKRADCRDLLGSIRCPVRVLCGRDDPVTPVNGNRHLADNIRGASLQILDDTGHLLPLERPAEVNGFLRDWLQQPVC